MDRLGIKNFFPILIFLEKFKKHFITMGLLKEMYRNLKAIKKFLDIYIKNIYKSVDKLIF